MTKERVAILVGLVLLTLLMVSSFTGLPWNEAAQVVENETVAVYLFQNFVISVIVIALLLAVSMVAGVFLAEREERLP